LKEKLHLRHTGRVKSIHSLYQKKNISNEVIAQSEQ
jgi:hypothetical protein